MNPLNPLLADDNLPRFDAVRPEHVAPAMQALLADADAALQQVGTAAVAADFAALSSVLDVPVERLRRAWGAVVHLHAVVDSPALREAYGASLPRVVDFTTRLAADEALFAKTRAIDTAALTPVQRKAVADQLRDARLGGAELVGVARERFAAIQDRLSTLSQRYGEHVLDATDAWSLDVDESRLDGVPADLRSRARKAAAEAGAAGCRLTLHAPCYRPVLQYATDRALRETLFRAKATLCSDAGAAAHDNSALMQELVALRSEEARLLGYDDYASLSLVAKMARTPQEVTTFLRELATRARPFAVQELERLRRHASESLGLESLQPWDQAFVAERLQQSLFQFSDDELRQYFPEAHVLDGLFRLIERLFDVAIDAVEAPVWHADVRCYGIRRQGQLIGHFYLDLHARPGKQAGAWMDECRQRWRRPDGGALQTPVAHLVCNFAPPTGERPALLSHRDLITLFHEFGHGLHHLLTQVDELSLSGIAGVEWDAAEVPSQFMENFCWEWEVLQSLSRHVDSGAALPRALFDRLHGARHFGSALRLLRYVEFALFDMLLHADPTPATSARRVDEVVAAVRAEVAVVDDPSWLRFAHSFTHVFDGGYAAGYYGYAWAEVLSADAYGVFEAPGADLQDAGRRWRLALLERGGSRPTLENFVDFRGREPTLDAYLRHQGLLEPEASLG